MSQKIDLLGVMIVGSLCRFVVLHPIHFGLALGVHLDTCSVAEIHIQGSKKVRHVFRVWVTNYGTLFLPFPIRTLIGSGPLNL